MQCSVELPVPYLDHSTHFNFDFVIASTWLVSEEYRDYYLHKREIRYTILDNGAFETGKAIDDDKYIEIVRELRPDVVACPDVFKDQVKTGRRAIDFINKWKSDPVSNVSLMGILQGNSWDTLVSMYKTLYKSHCQYIGFPYATGLDRFQFLKAHPEIQNVHILGLPNLAEALALRTLPNVVSIDSSLPVRVTKDKKYLENVFSSDSYVSSQESTLDSLKLQHNLDMFCAICNGKTKIVRMPHAI